MVCDAQGRLLAQSFPPEYGEAATQEAAAVLADGLRRLRASTGKIDLVDLRFAGARLVVRPAGEGALLVLCRKSVNLQQLLSAISAVNQQTQRPAAAPPQKNAAPPEPELESSRKRPLAALLLGVAIAATLAVAVGIYWNYGKSRGLQLGRTANAAATSGRNQAIGEAVLRIAGSNTLSAQLASALAEGFLASLQARDIKATSTNTAALVVEGIQNGERRAIVISTRGTASGFEELLAGTSDVGISTRRVKAEERQRLAALGSMTSQANEHVLGLDGLTVMVNNANNLPQLRREQLAAIFNGSITDWSSLGVNSDEQAEWAAVGVSGRGGVVASGVHVYAPDDASGVAEVFQTNVLNGKPMATEVKRLPTFQAVAEAVAADPGGIGFVPSPFARGTRAVPIADADEPALVATAFSVATEEYLLTHRLYLYTAQASKNPNVTKFVEYALGSQGQKIVKKAGFIELDVTAERRIAAADAPPEYLELTKSARKLSSTFRFEVGSSAFDNRAIRDVERVVEYLRENGLNGSGVRVLGFADSQGAKSRNSTLSYERATLVAKALAQRGISGVIVAGLGSSLPVADNATEDGRQRNRRVEIWVSR